MKEDALYSSEKAEEVLKLFYVARIGREPAMASTLKWKPVQPSSAKNEVVAVIALLRIFGLPPPSFQSLNVVFKNTGALRKKPASNKLPLFALNLERLWGLTVMKTNPFYLRNLALCATTYFFMLRGGEARILRRNQLEIIQEVRDETTWRVTLDSSKSDPAPIGGPPPGGSWEGYTSNPLFSSVMKYYLESFLSQDYPAHLPLFPQVEITKVPQSKTDPFSRKAPGVPSSCWHLLPLAFAKGGKEVGGHLTTSDPVNKWLKEVLPLIGVHSHHTMHSLRVGAATEALSLGAPISQIKKMGHWKSLAVLTYAADELTSIVNTTKLFGSKEISYVGPGVVEARNRMQKFIDGDGVLDGDGENSVASSSSSSAQPPA